MNDSRFWLKIRRVFSNACSRRIVFGLPAATVAVLLCLVSISVNSMDRQQLSERYFNDAMKATQDEDFETASLWLRKIIQMKPNDRDAKFRLGLIAAENGERLRGNAIIAELAPEDRLGYAPAHRYLAAQIIQFGDADATQESRVRWHLSAALAIHPRDTLARRMLAEHELKQQNLNDAIKHYLLLEKVDPSVNLVLAQLYVAKGERLDAEHAASRGMRHFKGVAREDETNIEAKIEWAKLEAFLENYDVAANLLGKIAAYQRVPEDHVDELRRLLADVYFNWSEALGRENPDAVEQRLKLLEMSLQFAPENARPFEALSAIGQSTPDMSQRVRSILADFLGKDHLAPFVHVNLALNAQRRGDLTLEREHLEIALNAAPRLGVAANNLAWNLASTDPDQIGRALELVETAIKSEPLRFEYRATKGRILAMTDRKEEAIAELQLASAKLRRRQDIHNALASLYYEVETGQDLPSNDLRNRVSRGQEKM